MKTIQADALTDIKLTDRIRAVWKQALNAIKLNLTPKLLETGKSPIAGSRLQFGRYYSYKDQPAMPLEQRLGTDGFNDFNKGAAFLVNSEMLPICENDTQKVNFIFVFFNTTNKKTSTNAFYEPANEYNKLPSIVVYCKFKLNELPAYDNSQSIEYFKTILDSFGANPHYLDIFQHEYTHYYEDITSKKGIKDRNRRKFDTSTEGGYAGYVNSSHEVNARYMQIVGKIWALAKQYKLSNTTIIKMLPTFDDFFTLIWHQDYTPQALIKYATPATKKRVIKRLHGVYQLFKNQKQPDVQQVAQLVKKQLEAA